METDHTVERAPFGADRRLVALAWAVALLGLALSWRGWLTDLTYPGMPWQDPHEMADFRDTVWAPGRFLLSGLDPYDPQSYLPANPGSQEFDPYAPAWFLLAAPLSLLPFTASAAAYLAVGAVLAVVLVRLVLTTAAPRLLPVGTPLGVAWFALWSPGRYALQAGGTILIFIGWVLVMRVLLRRDAALGPLGLALVLLKPQFGLPLVVVLVAAGRARVARDGIAVLVVASLPALVACVIAAGGPAGFVDAVLRLLAYATSPDSATGLLSPFNGRIDLVGALGRFGVEPPGWVQLAVVAAATALACLLARRATPVVASAGIAAAVLLGLVHQPYDAVILILPFAVGLAAPHRPRGRLERAVWVLAAIPVLHLHRVSTLVLGKTGADLVDVAALVVALALAVGVTLRATATTFPISSPPTTSPPPPSLDDAGRG